MSEKRDYYEVLNISKNASDKEISKAFRKISLKYHPDRQHGKTETEKKQAEEKFKEAAEAYEVLSDKDKRAKYDQFGFDGPSGFSNFQSSMNMADILSKFGSFFGGNPFSDTDDFNPFSGFGFNQQNSYNEKRYDLPDDGRNVQIEISVPFKNIIKDTIKEIDLMLSKPCSECNATGIKNGSKPSKCPHCKGTGMISKRHGMMVMSSTCPFCHGEGYEVEKCPKCHGNRRTPEKKHIKFKIPTGIVSGTKLKISGNGECGVCGGSDGDLFIKIIVQPSNIFKQIEKSNFLTHSYYLFDLETQIYISPIIAAIGGEVDVPTPQGFKKLKIKAGIKNNSIEILKHAGLQNNNSKNFGDLYVTIYIDTLVNLKNEQKQLLQQLESSINETNFLNNKNNEKIKKELEFLLSND